MAAGNKQLKFADHYLTLQTKEDIIISCNAVILSHAWMRNYCIDNQVLACALGVTRVCWQEGKGWLQLSWPDIPSTA